MTETIPEGWERAPLSDTEHFKVLSSGIDKFEGEKHYLSTSSIVNNKIVEIEQEITYTKRPSRANMQPIENSVWFARMKATLKVLKSNKQLSDKYILSTGFCGIKCLDNLNSGYLEQVFLSREFNKTKDLFSTGSTQQGITNEALPMLMINIPPLPEQEKIADILSKTDEQIQLTEEIIAKTEELKKGLMGIFFNEETMKNWKKDTFKNVIVKLKRGHSLSTNSEKKGVIYLTSGFLKNNDIDWNINKYLDTDKSLDNCMLEKGDLILNCVNSYAKVGKVALFKGYKEKVVVGFNNFGLKLDLTKVLPSFMKYYCLQAKFQYWLKAISKPAVNQVSFSGTDLNRVKIKYPSIEEQKKISIAFENIEQFLIDNRLELRKLYEIKKGLMQDLLTGKVRVNNLIKKEVAA